MLIGVSIAPGAMLSVDPPSESLTPLFDRVRSEFLEMPGLRVPPVQAARLWAVDRQTSERILHGLVTAGFLIRNREGAYVRTTVS